MFGDDMFSAAATLGAGMLSSATQLWSDQQNKRYSERVMDRMVELSNTAHQREVADLKAAGLNPVLSAQGVGSSVPQLQGYTMSNPGEGVAGGISSAAKLMALEVPKVESQVAVNSATAKNLEAQNDLIKSQINNTDAQTLRTLEESDHPGALGGFLQTVNSLFNGSDGHRLWQNMRKPDPPSSARRVHDLGTVEVDAPVHRWYHHLPGFRD